MMSGRSGRREKTLTGNPPGWSRDLGGQTNGAIQGRWEPDAFSLGTTVVLLIIAVAALIWIFVL